MFGSMMAMGVGLALSLTPPQTDKAPAQPLDLHPVEARVIERTNSQRIRHGLRPLRVDRRLLFSARRHAAWASLSRYRNGVRNAGRWGAGLWVSDLTSEFDSNRM